MVGPINLTVQGKIDGIEAAFDRAEIKPGEKATLIVKAADGAKAGALMYVYSKPADDPVQWSLSRAGIGRWFSRVAGQSRPDVSPPSVYFAAGEGRVQNLGLGFFAKVASTTFW